MSETTATSILDELGDIRRFQSTIKSTLLLALTWDTMNLGTFSPRHTSLNEVIRMPEKSCSSAFTTSLQLVIPIPAISLTFMRNEKNNRQ